jgi:phosphoribosylcarboxyaminoimidazole (NCAIR) mutase
MVSDCPFFVGKLTNQITAIGKAGAKNAAVFAVQILALSDAQLEKKLTEFREAQTKAVLAKDAELNR